MAEEYLLIAPIQAIALDNILHHQATSGFGSGEAGGVGSALACWPIVKQCLIM